MRLPKKDIYTKQYEITPMRNIHSSKKIRERLIITVQHQINFWDIDLSGSEAKAIVNQFHLLWCKWTGESTARQPPKRKWFCRWWPHTISFSLSLQTDFSLVLHFTSVLIPTGSMRLYLQPIQVAQIVPLL